jgi:hypothetical protein
LPLLSRQFYCVRHENLRLPAKVELDAEAATEEVMRRALAEPAQFGGLLLMITQSYFIWLAFQEPIYFLSHFFLKAN